MSVALPIRADSGDEQAFVPVAEIKSRGRHDLRCPHCKSPGSRSSSVEVTITYREIYYECRTVACGHTWKASLTYDYGLSPSAIPDPEIDLPMKPLPRAAVLRAIAEAGAPAPDPNQPGLFDTGSGP